MKKFLFTAVVLCLVMAACDRPKSNEARLVPAENFEDQMDTIPVRLYTLTNGKMAAQVTNYGARVVTLFMPDRDGKVDNILVGRNSLKDYMLGRGERYLGAITGPVTGRIGGGSFTLDGVTYQTDKNDGANTLNGGTSGIDKRPWKVLMQTDSTIQMQVVLPDGDGGFPGKRVLQVTYAISDMDFLVIARAYTNARTPLSMAWQPYFNLHGEGEGTVEDLELAIPAGYILALSDDGVPTGELAPVEDTPLDFHGFHKLGEVLSTIKDGKMDFTWCLGYDPQFPMHEACRLQDPVSGREVTVLTNRPGLQVSTAGGFDGVVTGANGKPIAKNGAVLLSAQDWPNAVNQPKFPTVIVDPAGYFSSTTLYRFGYLD